MRSGPLGGENVPQRAPCCRGVRDQFRNLFELGWTEVGGNDRWLLSPHSYGSSSVLHQRCVFLLAEWRKQQSQFRSCRVGHKLVSFVGPSSKVGYDFAQSVSANAHHTQSSNPRRYMSVNAASIGLWTTSCLSRPQNRFFWRRNKAKFTSSSRRSHTILLCCDLSILENHPFQRDEAILFCDDLSKSQA